MWGFFGFEAVPRIAVNLSQRSSCPDDSAAVNSSTSMMDKISLGPKRHGSWALMVLGTSLLHLILLGSNSFEAWVGCFFPCLFGGGIGRKWRGGARNMMSEFIISWEKPCGVGIHIWTPPLSSLATVFHILFATVLCGLKPF